LTAAAAALAKALSIGSALISIPMTLSYLGAERFGMWMTISSFIAVLAFADFGIANGVLNTVAAAHGRDDRAQIQRAISSGFLLLLGIAAALGLCFLVIYPHVAWSSVFNVRDQVAQAEAGAAIGVFVTCFLLNIPLAAIQRAQMGMQQGFTTSLWNCLGSIAGLVSLLFFLSNEVGLPWLILALMGGPLLASLGNVVHFAWFANPDLRPRIAAFDTGAARRILATGVVFFVLQIVVALAYSSDSLVIAQRLGAAEVTAYALPEKLFTLISTLVAIALAPFWPAYGEALSRGDTQWVRRTLRRTLLLGICLASVASLLLVMLAPWIISLWIRQQIEVSFLVLLACGVWKVIEAGGVAAAMLLNGANLIALQLWCAIPTAILSFSLKWYLVPAIGVSGAVWASIIAYLLCTAIPIKIFLPRILNGDFSRSR